jgi:hypothetical protein
MRVERSAWPSGNTSSSVDPTWTVLQGFPDPVAMIGPAKSWTRHLAPPRTSDVELETTAHVGELGLSQPWPQTLESGALWRGRLQ